MMIPEHSMTSHYIPLDSTNFPHFLPFFHAVCGSTFLVAHRVRRAMLHRSCHSLPARCFSSLPPKSQLDTWKIPHEGAMATSSNWFFLWDYTYTGFFLVYTGHFFGISYINGDFLSYYYILTTGKGPVTVGMSDANASKIETCWCG